ncbi:TPA: hypothetical protein ACLM9O_002059, partial [Neisseria meningitidis]
AGGCRLKFRHSRKNGNLELLIFQTTFEHCRYPMIWIPTCAGMTRFQVAVFKLLFRVAVFYGNDKVLDCENLSAPPSFPRKWESRNEKQQEFIVNDRNRTD